MAKVIDFKEAKRERPVTSSSITANKDEEEGFWESILPPLFEWNEYFLELVYQWPCFHLKDRYSNIDDLLSEYCEHHLNPSQECVIDFMLHIHDSRYLFNITYALKTWSEADCNFFIFFLDKYALLINNNETSHKK
jgi:hypothetical protein